MSNPTTITLTGLIAWTLFLLIVMEILRVRLVATGRVAANGFKPDNSNLSPFMQRLARAHANCVESFPVLGGLLLVALVTDRASVTDPLAYGVLVARVFQSSAHLASLSIVAVNVRFLAFVVQLAIAAFWTFRLLTG